MIKDNIKKANEYYSISERIEIGLKYLQNNDLSKLENGKYEISGNEVYVSIQDYVSKEEKDADFEAHKKYIDIQYIIDGEEKIGVDNLENFIPKTEYNENKDIIFLKRKDIGQPDFVKLKKNEFAIFTPQDAHMPSLTCCSPSRVKKAVVKVLI